MRKINKKGQAAITDLFVAVGIFIILITITSVLWNLYNVRLLNRLEYDNVIVKSFEVSDLMLKTPGEPDNWDYLILTGAINYDEIKFTWMIGEELKISVNKTAALDVIGEESLREIFHAGPYRMGIRIRNNESSDQYLFGKVSGGSKFSVNLARDILYQNETGGPYRPAVIEVIISK